MYGAGLFSDGSKLWIFGGTNGTAQYADLYSYEPTTHTFTKIAPTGGVQPPTTRTAFPMMAFDSTRNRLVFYAGNDQLWQFSLATKTWTSFAAGGHGPVIDGLDQLTWGHADACGYDPVQDAMVCTYFRAQASPVGMFVLQFLGS
jgi:hypothetical protein